MSTALLDSSSSSEIRCGEALQQRPIVQRGDVLPFIVLYALALAAVAAWPVLHVSAKSGGGRKKRTRFLAGKNVTSPGSLILPSRLCCM